MILYELAITFCFLALVILFVLLLLLVCGKLDEYFELGDPEDY